MKSLNAKTFFLALLLLPFSNMQAQEALSDYQDDYIRALEADQPRSGVDYNSAIFFSAGLGTHLPSSDYVDWGLGIDFEMGYIYKRHVFGIAFDINGGHSAQQDIICSKGTIYKDESITSGGMFATYGIISKQTSRFKFTPFAGLGVRGYSGGTKEPRYCRNDEDDDHEINKNGFSLGFGLTSDIFLKRSKREYGASRHAIRIKPFVSMTHYGHDMNFVPSFNLAISWSWSGDELWGGDF